MSFRKDSEMVPLKKWLKLLYIQLLPLKTESTRYAQYYYQKLWKNLGGPYTNAGKKEIITAPVRGAHNLC